MLASSYYFIKTLRWRQQPMCTVPQIQFLHHIWVAQGVLSWSFFRLYGHKYFVIVIWNCYKWKFEYPNHPPMSLLFETVRLLYALRSLSLLLSLSTISPIQKEVLSDRETIPFVLVRLSDFNLSLACSAQAMFSSQSLFFIDNRDWDGCLIPNPFVGCLGLTSVIVVGGWASIRIFPLFHMTVCPSIVFLSTSGDSLTQHRLQPAGPAVSVGEDSLGS
jgi:hypothetical protein